MARRHQISMLADLAVLSITIAALSSSPCCRGVLWGRSWRRATVFWAITGAKRHGFHALICLPHLNVSELLLEELQVTPPISELGV